jgi:acetyltransferase-like isoleucine patch superfamily enzyme
MGGPEGSLAAIEMEAGEGMVGGARAVSAGEWIDDPLPLPLIPRALNKLYSTYLRWSGRFWSVGTRASIHYTTSLRNPQCIQLGSRLIVDKDVWLHAVEPMEGASEPKLIVDDYCYVGRRSHVTAKNRVHLEREVILSSSVLVQDHAHEYEDVTRPIRQQGLTEGGRIRIGQGSWIGQGVVIFCGRGELTLGRNCVVAANSVVTRSFPDYCVVSGNPARVVKQFDPAKGAWAIGAVRSSAAEAGGSGREE